MAHNFEEQEQLDALKHWWEQYGNFVVAMLAVVLLATSAYMGWQWYQRTQAERATLVYEALYKATEEKNQAKVTATVTRLLEDFPRTSYAPLGALLAARSYFDGHDLAAAKKQLQWVVEHAHDLAYLMVARLRLAEIALDEEAYDAGLEWLDVVPPASFERLFADARGDLFAAQNKIDEARKAYDQALAAIKDNENQNDSQLRVIIELKRDALSSLGVPASVTPAPMAAAPAPSTTAEVIAPAPVPHKK